MLAKFADSWFGRIGTAVGLYQAVPATVVAAVTAYYSTGVTWLAALGPFGWIASGIAGFLLTSVSLWLLARARFLRVEARMRERLNGDSSPFDPMARVYENKRIYVRDLAPLGRKQVRDKRFINCEIIGPGTIVLGMRTEGRPDTVMKNCNTQDVDVVQMDPAKQSYLAIWFWDCDFDGCTFYHMTLLFGTRQNETLNWITPNSSAPLLEHKDNDTTNASSTS